MDLSAVTPPRSPHSRSSSFPSRVYPQSSEQLLLAMQVPCVCVRGGCWVHSACPHQKKTYPGKAPCHLPHTESTEVCDCLWQAAGSGRNNLGTMPTPPEHPDRHPPARGPVPMTVRWVLAVMLVTTLVAMHSHSPWSSLLRARNWRLPLGRVLCLLLLGFPTLAKQGGKEEGGSRAAGEESGRAGEERSHQQLRGRRRG